MKITAIAPWFGAKRTLSHEIIAELGPHAAYWEPFCGSMAILLSKQQCTMETVNDLHGDLVNLARTIQHPTEGPRLYRRLRRTLMSRELFEESADVIRQPFQDPTPDRAYHYFVVSWLGRNGVSGTGNYNAGFCVRYTKNGGHAAKRFASAVESIPSWRARMRGVTILRSDGLDLLERIEDSPGVVIYCDPPYLVKGCKYLHDFTPDDHAALAGRLRRFQRTRVVVSYYDHPLLDGFYPDWTIRHLKATKSLVNQGMRDKAGIAVKAPEVLLINGPSFVEPEGLF